MLPRDALVVAVKQLPVEPRRGLAFRLILARYAATALSSIGSLRAGGRYNMRGEFEALYLASSPVTALREVEALVATAEGLRGVKGPPRILLSIEYELEAVVDLTEPNAQQLFGQQPRGIVRTVAHTQCCGDNSAYAAARKCRSRTVCH